MSYQFATCAPITIAAAGSISRTVDVQAECSDAEWIGLNCPTMTGAATSIIEVSDDAVTFRALKNDLNAAIIGPASNTAIRMPVPPFPYFRLRTNVNETVGISVGFHKLWNAY